MRKGIIFSMDAILALIAVILLIAWIPMQANEAQSQENIFQSLHENAFDSMATGFYLNEAPQDTSLADNAMGKCFVYYDLDPNEELGKQSAMPSKKFCKGIGSG